MMALLTRFDNLKYENFKIEFKGILFEIKRLDDMAHFPNDNNKKNFCEEFKVIVTYKDKSIEYKFYNSVMEQQISKGIEMYKGKMSESQIIKLVRPKMWAGYDECKNLKSLTEKRIYYLLYSIINCMSNDLTNDLSSFSWFCSNYGYDEDSITANNIYRECQIMKSKLLSLHLDSDIIKYLEEEAGQESETFSNDILKAIEKAKQTTT